MLKWYPWSSSTFHKAAQENKPLLLYLFSSRSHLARRLDQESYADPKTVALIEFRFIPIRVNIDQRPDLALRYAQEGVPTQWALTPSGDPFWKGSYLEATALREALEKVGDLFREHPEKILDHLESQTNPVLKSAELSSDWVRKTLGDLLSHGHPPRLRSLEFLLYAAREFREEKASKKLKQIISDGRDLTLPESRILFRCGRWAKFYLDAFTFSRDSEFKRRGVQALEKMRGLFCVQEKGFSEDGRHFYAEDNAIVIPALLKAAAVLDTNKTQWESLALEALSFLRDNCFNPQLGLRHHWHREEKQKSSEEREEDRLMGLLGDQAWTLLAFTQAHQYFGEKSYRDFADVLLKHMFQTLWDREGGGFWDRVEQEQRDWGRLKWKIKPVEENLVVLEALWRLHYLKGSANYKQWLQMGLENIVPLASSSMSHLSFCARITDHFLNGRMELNLVGKKEDPQTRRMLEALHRFYIPRAVISFIDPDDQDFILAHKMKVAQYPHLFFTSEGKVVSLGGAPSEIEIVLKNLSQISRNPLKPV
ncbi:MAG: thioredoxin domain-containing protein [Elusimicrobia bacterium]|nr:thioredoxin domain-containing protein [Elusimicrobiota bacterium]